MVHHYDYEVHTNYADTDVSYWRRETNRLEDRVVGLKLEIVAHKRTITTLRCKLTKAQNEAKESDNA